MSLQFFKSITNVMQKAIDRGLTPTICGNASIRLLAGTESILEKFLLSVDADLRVELTDLLADKELLVEISLKDGIAITKHGNHSEVVLVSDDGIIWPKESKPSSDLAIHQTIYKYNPHAKAILHLHSPHVTALATLLQKESVIYHSISVSYSQEVSEAIGHIAVLSIDQIPAAGRGVERRVFFIDGVGAFVVGPDIKDAYRRFELLEHALKVHHLIDAMERGKKERNVRRQDATNTKVW